jgi:hypothetical protein
MWGVLSLNIGHGRGNLMTKQIQSIGAAACVARLLTVGNSPSYWDANRASKTM